MQIREMIQVKKKNTFLKTNMCEHELGREAAKRERQK